MTRTCATSWCDSGPHAEDTSHFAAVVELEMSGGVDVAIYISDVERSGLSVTLDLHVGDEEGGLQVDIGPGRAYALAQILAALDSDRVLEFAERLSYAAVTLDPSVVRGVSK